MDRVFDIVRAIHCCSFFTQSEFTASKSNLTDSPGNRHTCRYMFESLALITVVISNAALTVHRRSYTGARIVAAVADDCPQRQVGADVSSNVELLTVDVDCDDTAEVARRRGQTHATDVQL